MNGKRRCAAPLIWRKRRGGIAATTIANWKLAEGEKVARNAGGHIGYHQGT
ncbi:hypothetical protein [Janthinobacterium rivuli]|uniref:hypothetical protein n=1 Tax=Janthinobacterium rivuli TaxID=2751478 RepID=UPI00383BB5B4